MKNINTRLSNQIFIQHNSADLNINFDKNEFSNFIYFNVSHFDHWLTEEEFVSAPLVCYTDTIENVELFKEFSIINNEFRVFYKKLFDINKGLILAADDKYYEDIDNYHTYARYVENALKEMPVCQFVFIELGMIIFLRYDFTHGVFISKKNKIKALKVQRLIKKLAKENNLHII